MLVSLASEESHIPRVLRKAQLSEALSPGLGVTNVRHPG